MRAAMTFPRRELATAAPGGRVFRSLCGRGLLPAMVVLLSPGASAAQQDDCQLVKVGGYTHRVRVDSLTFRHHASGGIDYRCADGTRILADSAAVFESSNTVQLFGNVHFEDLDTELDADRAIYFGSQRRLNAWDDVTVTDRHSGAVIHGDTLIFYRASEFRPLDRILVYGGEPTATVQPVARPGPPVPDSAAIEGAVAAVDSGTATVDVPTLPSAGDVAGAADSVALPPYEIEAERFMIDGRRFFRAGGGVVVVRDSLRAVGDSLDFDQEVGTMSVIREAHVADRGFELTGSSISVTPGTGLREEILAREQAELVGSQVVMRAPAIRVFLNAGQVDRLVAVASVPPLPGEADEGINTAGLSPGDAGRARVLAAAREQADSLAAPDSLSRPSAFADDFYLTADSIEVLSPDQLLNLVTAVGSARAEAADQDSLDSGDLPEVARRDWMVGQTIIAHFAPAEPRDGAAAGPSPAARRSRLETLTSVGEARSLYRLVASDTTRSEPGGPPALHLVEGEQITIHLEEREVVKMEVEGQTIGYHLEPSPPGTPDSTATATDSAAIAPDSVLLRPDTTSVTRLMIRPHRGGPA